MKPRKKQSQKRRKQTLKVPARYLVGNRVQVKPGTADPDFRDIPLGGWSGTVVELDQRSNPPTYLIEWDQATLDQMHPVYRTRCERDGLMLESMWLSEIDLEQGGGGPVVVEQPTHIVARPLSKHDPEDRIRAIFSLTNDDPLPAVNGKNLRHYTRHLKAQLSFPVLAKCLVERSNSQLEAFPVKVLRLLDDKDCDGDDGILCEVEALGDTVAMPLAVLEVRHNRNHRQLIEDYSHWFEEGVDEFWASEDGSAREFDTPIDPSSLQNLVTVPLKCGLSGAAYGVVLGALLSAVEGTLTGVWVGAVLLCIPGTAIGMIWGPRIAAENRLRYGSFFGGIIGVGAGSVLGATVGAMVVAFLGTSIGGLVGALIGRFMAKRIGILGGMAIGAGLGAVTLAFCRDQEAALSGALHGAWIGAISAVILLLAAVGLVAVASRSRRLQTGD